MDLIFYFVFGPAGLFVGSPLPGLLMAISFAILLVASVIRSRMIMTGTHLLLLVAVCLWVVQSMWEFHALGMGWNIRVDIMFWWPVLMPITLAAVLCAGKELFASRPIKPKCDNT